ncbi:hypothetical protein ACI65C_010310 [Semiaphis heraclei]
MRILPIVVDIPTQVRRVITRREKGGGLLPDLRYYEGRFESRRKRVLKSKSKISFRLYHETYKTSPIKNSKVEDTNQCSLRSYDIAKQANSFSCLFQRMEAFRDAVRRVMSKSSDDQQLDCVLMASVQKQLTEVADAVASVWPLAALSDPERRECAKTSAVKRFPARSIIYADDANNSVEANAYFVLEGRCTCMQRLRVRKTTEYGRNHFTLIRDHCSDSQSSSDLNKNVQTVYVKMTDLRPGSVFGLGERRSGRIVIATADVKCLLVPLAFLAKHNTSNVWGRTVCSLNGTNPTAEQSFRKFVVENRWAEYKKSLADDLSRKRRP